MTTDMSYKDIYLKEKPWLRHYPEGMPNSIEFPVKSLIQAFDEVTDKWHAKTAILFYGARITYRELRNQVDRFAAGLYHLGVSKGDMVGLLLVNSPQTIISFYGAMKAGAIVTPISPIYTSYEVKHQLQDSGARTVICMDILYDTIEKTGLKLDNVIVTNLEEYLPVTRRILGKTVAAKISRKMEIPKIPRGYFDRPGFYNFQDLIKKNKPEPPNVKIDPKEDIAIVSYTGGTTGLPKGIMLTHYSLLVMRTCFFQLWMGLREGKENFIGYLPMYHIFGIMSSIINGILSGGFNILLTTPDRDDILKCLQKYKPSVFYGVPSMFKGLADYDKTTRVNWKRLKAIVCSADSLLEDVVRAWEKRTGTIPLEGYGLTEMSGGGCGNIVGKPRIGTFGVPSIGMKAAVIEPETREFLPPGEIGELILSHPCRMKGYWKRPEETEKAFLEIDEELWVRTGDLVRMDDDGFFYFYDRKADLIKYKGYSVLGREVEEVLTGHPQVKEAGVIGIPDQDAGQIVKAVVVLEREARGKISENELLEYCKERLAQYKLPRIIEFKGEIPKTDVGKVSHRELKEGG
jgi:long-chain acyl-CoA synthetase